MTRHTEDDMKVDVIHLLYKRYVSPIQKEDNNEIVNAMQQAYWHYIDHLVKHKLSFHDFVFKISRPLQWKWPDIRRNISNFEREQRKLPRCGGILVNEDRTHCLLIRAPKSKYWTLPAGKKEKEDKSDAMTAEREVKEEVGYTGEINPDFKIEYRRRGAPYTMFIIDNVPMNHRFYSKYPDEISKIEWFPLHQVKHHVKYAGKFIHKLQNLLASPKTSPTMKSQKCSIEDLCEELTKTSLYRTKTCDLYTPNS